MRVYLAVVLTTLIWIQGTSCTKKKKNNEEDAVTDENTPTATAAESTIAAPSSIEDGTSLTSIFTSPEISWETVTDESLDHYEIALGTSPGEADIVDWTDVGTATTYTFSSLSLSINATYYPSIRSVDSDGVAGSSVSGDGWLVPGTLTCPTGYVLVLGNTTATLGGSRYTNGSKTRLDGSERSYSQFCVMKYEAKLYDGDTNIADGDFDGTGFNVDYMNPGDVNARSTEEGKPWVNVSRNTPGDALDAIRACSNLGENYHLINNAMWQTIARDIESVNSNWDGDPALAATYINNGHSDNNPTEACDGAVANVDTDCSTSDGGNPHRQIRTNTLANDEVIWDIGGNVYEWLIDDRPDPVNDATGDGFDSGGTTWVKDEAWGDEEGPAGSLKLMWGPAGDRTGKDVINRGGLGAFTDAVQSAIVRSGSYSEGGTLAGVFFTYLLVNESGFNRRGFRCVWAP